MRRLERMPTGFQWLLLFVVWIYILGGFAILSSHLNNILFNIVLKWLFSLSLPIGLAFFLLVVVSAFYTAKYSQNAKNNAIRNPDQQGNILYPIAHVNWYIRIAYSLAESQYSQSDKGETGKPQNNAYYEQEPFHFILSPLSDINRIIVVTYKKLQPNGNDTRKAPP